MIQKWETEHVRKEIAAQKRDHENHDLWLIRANIKAAKINLKPIFEIVSIWQFREVFQLTVESSIKPVRSSSNAKGLEGKKDQKNLKLEIAKVGLKRFIWGKLYKLDEKV